MKSCGVCAIGCSTFRGSDRFTVTNSVQEGRGISLSRRDLPVISALVAIRQGQALRIVVEVDQRVAVVDLDVEKLRHVKFQGRVVNDNSRKLIITGEVHPSPW
jgi:hypothetical protein